MNALVIYDSVFGNTEKVALAIGQSLLERGGVKTLSVAQVTLEMLAGVDLLVIGSPTRSFRPTEGMTKLINSFDKSQVAGQRVATFDTRIALETIDSSALRFIVNTGGYAATTIAKALKKKGANLIASPEGFLVTGEQGPLKDGELERAAEWAKQLL